MSRYKVKYPYIQHIFARDYIYCGFGMPNYIKQYCVTDFDYIWFFGIAEVVYKSGVTEFVLFRYSAVDKSIYLVRQFSSRQRVDIAFSVIVNL